VQINTGYVGDFSLLLSNNASIARTISTEWRRFG